MVELLEYALTVMASALLMTGSVVVYNSFTSYEAGLQLRGTFSAVEDVAASAIANGSAASTLPLPASTIGCEGNTLYVSVGLATMSQGIAAECGFRTRIPDGTHLVSFRTTAGRLDLTVS